MSPLLAGRTFLVTGAATGIGAAVTGLFRQLALRRIAEPGEIATCALFLASDLASFVTGAVLVADGGGRVPASLRAV